MEEMCDQEEAREVFEQPDTTVQLCCARISSQHQENWIQETNPDWFLPFQEVFWKKYLGEQHKFKVWNKVISLAASMSRAAGNTILP